MAIIVKMCARSFFTIVRSGQSADIEQQNDVCNTHQLRHSITQSAASLNINYKKIQIDDIYDVLHGV